MKLFYWILILVILFTSCKKDEVDVVFEENYGSGMYIVTDIGVSFYNSNDSLPQVNNDIFKTVNNISINNPKKIKFRGTKAYILAENTIVTANVKTFEDRGMISGFVNAVDFDFVNPDDRIFVVDKDDSKVKVVDTDRMEIISDIETGDNTKPVFIISKWYRSIIMNGGGVADTLKDSTIVAIDYRDELVPISDMMGSLFVGYNPNSAIHVNDLKVLCKGIYDPNNSSSQTNSVLVTVNPYSMKVTASQNLNGIYNANNLVSNNAGNALFFTASDGIYSMNDNGGGVSQIDPIISDILYIRNEQYNPTDSTTASSNMLYVNDAINNTNKIYKYNLSLSSFVDTIIVDAHVRDINFY